MTVYLIAGHAGTGKSTLGRALAAHLRCPVLDKDTLFRALVDTCNEALGQPPHIREGRVYWGIVRPAEYRGLHDAIFDLAPHVRDVVAVAPWLDFVENDQWRTHIDNRARAAGHDVVVVWVTCTDTVMRGRLTQRDDPADWSKLDTWIDVVDGRAAAPPRCADIVIDTTDGISTHTIADMVAAARRRSTRTKHTAYMK